MSTRQKDTCENCKVGEERGEGTENEPRGREVSRVRASEDTPAANTSHSSYQKTWASTMSVAVNQWGRGHGDRVQKAADRNLV